MDDFATFIERRTTDVKLRDGTLVCIRPIVPGDKDRMVEGLHRLSTESRYLRFLRPVSRLTADELIYLTEVDYADHFAWVALAAAEPGTPGIGVARYVRLSDDSEVAEAAVAVVDDSQGEGLGTVLLEALAHSAMGNGIRCFRAYVSLSNRMMLATLETLGASMVTRDGVTVADIPLPPPAKAIRDTVLYAALRAVAAGDDRADGRRSVAPAQDGGSST